MTQAHNGAGEPNGNGSAGDAPEEKPDKKPKGKALYLTLPDAQRDRLAIMSMPYAGMPQANTFIVAQAIDEKWEREGWEERMKANSRRKAGQGG